MTLKQTFTFEITKNERLFTFTMPSGTPIGEAYDVGHELLQALVKLAGEAAEKARSATDTSRDITSPESHKGEECNE